MVSDNDSLFIEFNTKMEGKYTNLLKHLLIITHFLILVSLNFENYLPQYMIII